LEENLQKANTKSKKKKNTWSNHNQIPKAVGFTQSSVQERFQVKVLFAIALLWVFTPALNRQALTGK
jgi:hypothetical protein